MFDFLKPKPKSTEDIQAELKALCMKMAAQSVQTSWEMDKYEGLLAELYKRGVEPKTWIKPLN